MEVGVIGEAGLHARKPAALAPKTGTGNVTILLRYMEGQPVVELRGTPGSVTKTIVQVMLQNTI